jgi:predicted ATPase/DNA-binding SARP family transcriptional activator
MEFRVLGPVEVNDGERTVAPKRDKERRVLAVLLAHANDVVSRHRLAEALWREVDGPEHAVRAVQTHVSRLRSILGAAGERLVSRPAGYRLRVEPGELDSYRFERLLDQARRRTGEDPAEALELFDRALQLWRGSPYGELRDEEFALADALRLEELRLVGLEDRIEARLALGQHEEVVGELEARCAEHPLRERLRSQLMLALHRSGRRPEALRAFEAYRRMLADELGLDPSPGLRTLEARILDHDPALARQPVSRRTPQRVVGPVSSFVGREVEFAGLSRRLAAGRVLSITGPGGVGKTRLALRVAAAVAERYADGVVVCELAAVGDPEAVVPAIATGLGVQRRPDRSVVDSMAEVLRTRTMLLVVDNCEHVVEAAASVISVLVGTCPTVTVLATSRERLAVDGEQVWRLDPLPVEAAVELFCERVRAVRPDLDCEGQARVEIIDICGRLDGLPLAIELAAAQSAAMNPADLVQRLDDRFVLLDRGSRSSPDRHRSLRAVVAWSYERLGESQRLLFDRLSVFAGSFTLEAAEEVCAGDGVRRDHVPQLVADLVEASLVTLAGDTDVARYRLLETLRSYGRDQLEGSGGTREWRQRHTDYYLGLAARADEGLGGADEGRWVRRLDAQIDELRAAHRWMVSEEDTDRALRLSAALHGYAYRTLRAEVFSWAEEAALLPGARSHAILPLVLGSAATGAWGRGDLAAARRLAEDGLAAAAGAPSGHLALQALTGVELFEGELQVAEAHSRRAAELAEAAGDQFQALVNRSTYTLALAYSGQTERAIEEAEIVFMAGRDLHCPSANAWARFQLGEVLMDQDPSRALTLIEGSLELAAAVGNTFLVGVAGVSATTIRARHGDPHQALLGFPELIALWHRAGNWTQQWTMLRSLVSTLVRLGQDEPAAMIYGALTASPTAPPLFGADGARLAVAVDTIERRAGRAQCGAWVDRGRHLTDDEVIAIARAASSRPPSALHPGAES